VKLFHIGEDDISRSCFQGICETILHVVVNRLARLWRRAAHGVRLTLESARRKVG
jgi:hypothetical protein